MKKLKIKPIRIILIFVIAFIVLEAIFYFSLQDFVNNGFFPFNTNFYFYTPILIALTAAFLVISLSQTFYEVDDTKIIHHKMSQTYTYNYKDILYVDEEWSIKHKSLLFYDNNGKQHILIFDKDGEIFSRVMKNAKLMDWDEYKDRFPNAKI